MFLPWTFSLAWSSRTVRPSARFSQPYPSFRNLTFCLSNRNMDPDGGLASGGPTRPNASNPRNRKA